MNSKHRSVRTSRRGIGLAALSFLACGGPLLAAGVGSEIVGAHPLFVVGSNAMVSILNTDTDQIVSAFRMGISGSRIAVITPDGRELVTAGRLSIRVLGTQKFDETTILLGSVPTSLAARPDSRRIYFSKDDNTVSVLDAATRRVIDNIKVGAGPEAMAADPERPRLYVANQLGRSVSVIDTDTDQVIATVPLGIMPAALAVTPDGRQLFAGSEEGIAVVNIDPGPDSDSARPAALLKVGPALRDMTVSQDGSRLYVLTAGASFPPPLGGWPVASARPLPVPQWPGPLAGPGGTGVPMGPWPPAVRPHPVPRAGAVMVSSTANPRLMATVDVGYAPSRLIENPTRHEIYVTNRDSNNVSVIDTRTNTVSDLLPVGIFPEAEALSADGRQLYVGNWADGTVSVLDVDAQFRPVVAPVPIGNAPGPVALIVKP